MSKVAELQIEIEGSLVGFDEALKKAGTKIQGFGKGLKSAGSDFAPMSIGITAFATASVMAASKFQASMNKVKALSQANAEEMEKLRGQALQLGKDSIFSAKEVGDAQGELAAAGMKVNDVLAVTPAVIDLAAAAQVGMGEAAKIASDTLAQFQLKSEDAGRAMDVIGKGANDSSTSLPEMALALQYAGGTAKSFGMNLEQTVAVMEVLANQSYRGEKAGTGLRSALVTLLAPTKKAAALMEEAGIKVRDSGGKIKSFTDILDQFKKANLDAGKIARIFGKETASVMVALAREGGDAVRQFAKANEDAEGTIKKVGQTLVDDLPGSIEYLSGELDGLAITIGDVFSKEIQGVLKFLEISVGKLSSLIDMLRQADPAWRQLTLGIVLFGAVAAPALVALGTFVTLTAKLIAFSGVATVITVAVKGMAVAFGVLNTALLTVLGTLSALLLSPIGAVLLALTALAYLGYEIYQNWEPLKALFWDTWEATKEAAQSAYTTITEFVAVIPQLYTQMAQAVTDALGTIPDAIRDLITKSIQAAQDLVSGVRSAFSNGFGVMKKTTADATQAVTDYFKDMYVAVVGNSYVPDMIKEVQAEFDKLEATMGTPTQKATSQVSKHFASMKDTTKAQVRAFKDDLEELQNQIRDVGAEAQDMKNPLVDALQKMLSEKNYKGINEFALGWATNSERINQFKSALREAQQEHERAVDQMKRDQEQYQEALARSAEEFQRLKQGMAQDTANSLQGILGGIGELTGIDLGAAQQGLQGNVGTSVGGWINDALGSIFGGSPTQRPAGVEGPLMETGSFTQVTDFAGSIAAIAQLLPALKDIGKNTASTVSGVSQAGGTAIASYFGLPPGLGQQAGKMLGDVVIDAFNLGGSKNVETQARKKVEKYLEDSLKNMFLFDGGKFQKFSGNVEFGNSGRWSDMSEEMALMNEVGSETFATFDAVGRAITESLGITEEIGSQIGVILLENFNSVDNLRMVVQELGLSQEQTQEALLKQASDGKISWLEYNTLIAGTTEAFKEGLSAVGAYTQAYDQFVAAGGRGERALIAFRNIAVEALEAGLTEMEDLKNQMLAEGADPEVVNAIFQAAAQRGITSLEQWAQASDATAGAIVGDMNALSATLKEQWEAMKGTLQDINATIESIPDRVEKSVVYNVEVNDPAGMLNGVPEASASVTPTVQAARGGVVTGASLFRHAGGMGLMGEAGNEGILPLAQVNGKLGVNAAGMGRGGITIIVNAQGAQAGTDAAIYSAFQEGLAQMGSKTMREIYDAAERGGAGAGAFGT